MPDLPVQPNPTPTIDAIYQLQIDNQGDWRRDHLGASIIGRDCQRELFYTFRWCTNPEYDGRLLRLFETGNREEARILDELVRLRLTVYTRHPNTGKQIHYELFGGHFGFNLDAIAQGFHEAPKTWHNVECKTMNTKNFAILKAKGVRVAKPEHYCQMQVYMGGAKLTRAYYIAVCKDDDRIHGERVHFEKDIYQSLVNKAEHVIFSTNPPCRISDNDNHPSCKWCDHQELCRGKRLPEVSCRTCAHVTPDGNGKWNCKFKEGISSSDQRHPCDQHIFIPSLVPMTIVDANADIGTVKYRTVNGVEVVNGPGSIPSFELWKWL